MTQSLFEQAMAVHSQGRVDEAMVMYQQIVEADPNHAGAIHLLGVTLTQQGQFQLAAQFIQNAIVLNAGVPEFHINLGNALMGMAELERAEHAYGRAVALNANIPEAWFGLGNARSAMKRTEEAVDAYKRAIALRPDFVEALVNMGGLLIPMNRLDEAVAALAHAASLRPNDPQPRFLLAEVLEAAGHPDEAATLYASMTDIEHCPVSILFEAGQRLARLRHHREAAALYQAALLRAPREMVLWNNLGNSLRELDLLEDAKDAYVQALNIAPNDALVLSNLGTVQKDLGNLSEAVASLRRAIEMGGDFHAHSNLGHALYLQGNLEGALHCFNAALAMAPGDPDATFHLGVVQLRLGNWAEGWKNYESRWKSRRQNEPRRHENAPLWDGGDLTGKTILIWSEQGLGDTLHFIRFADQLAAKGAKVVAECQPSLVPLLQTMPSLDQVVAVGQPLPAFDVQVPLLSLPSLLGLTLDNLPPGGTYLTAPSDRKQQWDDWHPTASPRVGVVWSGEARRQDVECTLIDRRRSISLDTLAPVLNRKDVQFVSLQLGPSRAQLINYDHVLDPAGRIRDFADTAALIDRLDLVISVDTSVAHLAAAMGKPVWLLSRFDGCWRWMTDRQDTPWYPSMWIYAQSEAGDWQHPVAALAEDMTQWVKTH